MPPSADLQDVGRLTAAIAAGDADAFSILYTARFPLVYSVVRRATGLSEPDCLDITQEAFLRMIRRIKVTDDPQALDAWLARVARTSAYDHLRALRRRRTRELRAARPDAQPDARRRLEEAESALAQAAQALALLDDDRAELLRLRFGRSMTLQTLARAVGLNTGAAHGRIERAVRDAAAAGPSDD